MPVNIMELITPEVLVGLSQSIPLQRGYMGDSLFPDIKTQYLKAEFHRLANRVRIPKMAKIHGWNTEAAIGSRPTVEKVAFEKFLIKEKLNQDEIIQQYLDTGVAQNALVNYVFDDVANLAETIKTRTEVLKMEALQNGKIVVKENNVEFELDYGVPSENIKNFNWSDPEHDILADIKKVVNAQKKKGQKITHVVTKDDIVDQMCKNKGIQMAMNGPNMIGAYIDELDLSKFIHKRHGFNITTNEDVYDYENPDGTLTVKEYIEPGKFIMYTAMANGTVGTGLWGATPEELRQGPWTKKSQKQFITVTMWEEPDPVAVWTKASGVFVPILPNPEGLVIAKITV